VLEFDIKNNFFYQTIVEEMLSQGEPPIPSTDTFRQKTITEIDIKNLRTLRHTKNVSIVMEALVKDISKKELEKIVEFNTIAEKISEKFWPGQITMLLPIRKEITQRISNNGKLAVRVPNNECVLSILETLFLLKGLHPMP